VACGGDFDLLGVVQHAVAVASLVGCGASLHGGIRDLHGRGAAQPGPTRSTTLEALRGAARAGSSLLGRGCVARGLVVITLVGYGVSPEACLLRSWW
jgi:hypothetical protein